MSELRCPYCKSEEIESYDDSGHDLWKCFECDREFDEPYEKWKNEPYPEKPKDDDDYYEQ